MGAATLAGSDTSNLLLDGTIAILYWMQYNLTQLLPLPVNPERFNIPLSVQPEGLGVSFRVYIALK
ncbi:MAG: hypothetical protein AB1861_03540 [Cyanobacteriota bacterium]